MRAYFKKEECPSCHTKHDPTLMRCPSCGYEDSSRRDLRAFEHHVHESVPWQIAYFLIQLVGFQLLGIILSLIFQVSFAMSHPGSTTEDFAAWSKEPGTNFALTAIAYLILTGTFAIIWAIRKKYPTIFASFKNYKAYLFGILGGVALIALQILYNLGATAILKAMGQASPTINGNETAIRSMVKILPPLALFIFGIVGPFAEEIGYRVGLFSLCSRFGKVLAYIISAVIFGFIHFNWAALFDPTLQASLANELIIIPSYIVSGLALGFIYDKLGLAGSLTAHVTNNMISLVITLVSGGNNA